MSEKNFDPKATIYHYLHMASKNYREFLQGENVKLKSTFMYCVLFWLVSG